ncbi:MAG: DNA polymerase III subunit beta [Candidatus Levybacteria bacterium]|nr:DNA polymerase III subunit beta [Candidatus Levybacteria bacterium]
MRILLLSENINKKLPFVSHAVSSRSQLPILSNFLLRSQKGKFYICATDLEIGIEENIPANIEEDGEITVPARVFFEFISGIQKGKILLYTKETSLFLESDGIKTVFQTMPPGDFPKLYEDKGGKQGTLKKDVVEKNFAKVVFAASQDNERPALSGVLFKKEKRGSFSVVATDGYRLSLKRDVSVVEEEESSDGVGFLAPVRLIKELISLKNNGDIGIYSSKKNNQIMFFQDETVLVGRLIEAEFPNYEKIIPSDFSSRTVLDRRELHQAVKSSSIFARETTNIIKFSLEKNKITLSASAPSLGESRIDVGAKTEGEENEIAFNARYLLELLGNIEEEEVVFEMSGPLNPGVFKIPEDPNFLHIIMPIRVQG